MQHLPLWLNCLSSLPTSVLIPHQKNLLIFTPTQKVADDYGSIPGPPSTAILLLSPTSPSSRNTGTLLVGAVRGWLKKEKLILQQSEGHSGQFLSPRGISWGHR